MAQYIDKSALVAQIEKCYNECLKRAKITDSDYWNAKADAYRNVLVILDDTLEVKEISVDLGDPKGDKSAKYIIDTNTLEVKEVDLEKLVNDYFTGWYFDSELDILAKPNNYSATIGDAKEIAKHFFELGLKAQKGE